MKTRTLFFIAICSMVFFACGTPSTTTESAVDSTATLVLDSASALVDSAAVDTTKK